MNDLQKARLLFNTAHRDKNDCAALLALTAGSSDLILQGYHAAGRMVSSKYMLNPFKSMPLFNEGKKMLEALLEQNNGNTELHYLRYAIQRNTPRFLGYHSSLEDDGLVLVEYLLKNKGSDLHTQIMIYLDDTNDELLQDLIT